MRSAKWLRGLRLRVFALITLVALAAAGAAAWLTLWQTSTHPTSADYDRNRVLFQVGSVLEGYARLHGTWEGVADVVQEQAHRTGMRIRLAEEDSYTIVDSEVGKPFLSTGPSYRLDVLPDPGTTLLPLATSSTPPGVAPKSPADVMWNELATYRRSVLLAACLTRSRLPIVLGPPSVMGVREARPGSLPNSPAQPDGTQAARVARDECVNKASASEDTADRQRMYACADQMECLLDEFHSAARAVGPAVLTLSAADPKPSLRFGRRPVFAAGMAVALVTILITVLLSQRVLRPIGTLTRVARGLADGDLSARVPVRGNDELAELARTFNGMADSLLSSENRQRRMIADIAHELRTPLANLRGYLEALRDGVLDPDRELFASLHDEALLQQRIVDDLQDLALAESGAMVYHWVALDVVELLRTCVTANRAAAESAGVVVRLADGDLPGTSAPLPVRADTDRLRQVFGNLITNALRATPAGGTVTLAAIREEAGRVRITVTDTGTGISADDLPHVFDRFWRADSARARGTGGSGLGLAIAREIITAHGGAIDVASTPGRGTMVTVWLPASELGDQDA